jgi:DNA-binding transcriptional MerR regulator/methylmalonyl-CoA mutase cobalamin-binding subunit
MGVSIPISAVERETGLSKDTLRMWERRYGFPLPLRDQFGDRLYPQQQVEKLRLIRRLMDQGFRPGRIIGEPYQALLEMTNGVTSAPAVNESDFVQDLLTLVSEHRVPELRAALQGRIQNMGLRRFILDLAAPLTRAVGEAWFRGELAIFEEHLFTEVMQNLLRKWIGEARTTEQRAPRILLTTFPSEMHGLGLLMAEALMTMDGAECLSFGIQMPIADIIKAAAAHQVDVVTLSFSAAYPRTRTSEGLAELRQSLPGSVEIWVGGGGISRIKRVPENVMLIHGIADVAAEIGRWRHQVDRPRAG